MSDRDGIFAGDDPFAIARAWLQEAARTEPNDPNAMALATVDAQGLPDVRVVLLKDIEGAGDDGAFVFYTNYQSAKAGQIETTGVAALVLHWKSLRRQIRVRGDVSRVEPEKSDSYFDSRPLESRIGAWASAQSRPIESRAAFSAKVEQARINHGLNIARPDHWGGYRIRPREIEFWSDGAFRMHDRFRWVNSGKYLKNNELDAAWEEIPASLWRVARLSP